MGDNHNLTNKVVRQMTKHKHAGCEYPEYEFRLLADLLNCNYEQVLEAFCLSDKLDKITKDEAKNNNKTYFELSVHSAWRLHFGIKNKERIKLRSEYKKQLLKAETNVRKLIKNLEDISEIEHDYHAKFRNAKLPSLNQLRELRTLVSSELNTIKQNKPTASNAEKNHAKLIAERLAMLFFVLNRNVHLGSKTEPTSVYARALVEAFDIFGINARYDTFASYGVKFYQGIKN